MGLCKTFDILPDFESQFAKLGIRPGLISHQAIDRLQNSEFKTELFYGLMMWHREIELRFDTPLKPEVGRQLQMTIIWLTKLINTADPDPFRSKVRNLIGTARFDEVVEMSAHKEAVSSLLTIHTVALAMATFETQRAERIDFHLRAHKAFPNDFFVNWYMATFAGGWNNAKEFALACYSLRSENPSVIGMLGFSYLEEGQYDLAVETLEKLVKVAPWYQPGQFRLAQAYHYRGDLELARKQYAASDRLLDSLSDRYLERVEYLRENQQHEIADGILSNLRDFRSPSELALSRRKGEPVPISAEERAEFDRLSESIASLLKQARKDTSNAQCFDQLRQHYIDLGSFAANNSRKQQQKQACDRAIEDLNAIAELDPENVAPHQTLARVCQAMGRTEIAIEAMRKVLAIEPDNPSHHLRLESLYRTQANAYRYERNQNRMYNSIDQAIEVLSAHSLSSSKGSPHAHLALARFCEEFNRFETAIVAIKRAIKATPDDMSLREKLSTLLLALGRQQMAADKAVEANASFTRAVQANHDWVETKPASWLAFEQLSIAYKYQGKMVDAFKYQKKVVELRPEYVPGRYRYAMLSIAVADQQLEQGMESSAIKTLDDTIDLLKAIHLDGFLMDLFDRLGAIQYEAGNLKRAVFLLRNVVYNRPGNHIVQQRLAQAYLDLGQLEDAESILAELRTTSPRSESLLQMQATLYRKQRQPEQAVSLLRKAQLDGINLTPLFP